MNIIDDYTVLIVGPQPLVHRWVECIDTNPDEANTCLVNAVNPVVGQQQPIRRYVTEFGQTRLPPEPHALEEVFPGQWLAKVMNPVNKMPFAFAAIQDPFPQVQAHLPRWPHSWCINWTHWTFKITVTCPFG
jgi:hypothetical protein